MSLKCPYFAECGGCNKLNISYDDMYSHVSKRTSLERVHPEGRNLNDDIKNQINLLNIDGVYLLKESKRDYLYNDVFN